MFAGHRRPRITRTTVLFAAAFALAGAAPTFALDTRVRIDSEPGAAPAGWHLDVVPGASNLVITSGGPRFGASVSLSGYGPTWRFDFSNPIGIPFGQGICDPAGPIYPTKGELPTLQLTYDNGSTTMPTGRYEIRKATWDASGRNLTSLWAVVRYTGANRFGPGVNAEIRWNADTSLYLRCPRVVRVYTADSASIPLAGIDTRGRPVTLAASPLPPGADLVPTGPGVAVLRWPATPAAEGSWPVRITATNDEGLQDTCLTVIRVVHRLQFSVSGGTSDPVTNGQSLVLQRPDVTFYKSASATLLGTDLYSWYKMYDFDATASAALGIAEGTYEHVQTWGAQSSEEVGINFASFGRSCSALGAGRLVIRRLRYASDGTLASVWTQLEETCASATEGLRSELRWNADTTIDVQAPVLALAKRGEPVRFDVTSLVAGPGPARLEALSLPAGAAFSDDGDGTGAFQWDAGPAMGTTATARFRAIAPSGSADTVTARIQSRVPFFVRLWGAPGTFQYLGRSWLYDSPYEPVAITESAADSSLTFAVQGQGHSWAFTFTAPASRRLTTGAYDSTDDDHAHLTPRARFRSGRDNFGSGYASSFHIRRLARTPAGAVRSLWATFRFSEEPGAPPDSGEIRFDTDTTLYVLAPGELARPTGAPFAFDARAVEQTGAAVAFDLLSAPPGATLADHGDATAAVEVPGGLPPGLWPVVLRTASASGVADTTTVTLRVLAPATLVAASDVTDPVALGESATLDEADAYFRVAPTTGNGVQATVATGEHVWSLGFWAPNGAPLSTGIYEHPVLCNDCGYAAGARPRMNLLRDGHVCQTGIDGSFDVRRLRRAPDGSIRSMWVVFAQTCNWNGGLRGDLRYDADTSVYLRVPSYVATEVGRPTTVAVAAVDTRGLPVSFAALGAPPGTQVVDHGDGTAALEWPLGPTMPGPVTLTWIATSGDGRADTASTVIEAFRTALFVLKGEPGDPVSLGGSMRWTGSDGTVTTSVFSDSTVNVKFSGSGHTLEFDFAAPFGRALREGLYEEARIYTKQQRSEPGLLVKVDGRLCDPDSAGFEVRQVRRDAAGAVTSLWVTFAQRCAGNTAALAGEVRLSADTSLYVVAPADRSRRSGQDVAFDVRAVDTRGPAALLEAVELPDGAVFTPAGPGVGRLDWSPTDAAGAVRRVAFAARSTDGRTDTVVTLVRTFAPDVMHLASVTGDYIGLGKTYVLAGRDGPFRMSRSGSALAVDWTGLHDSWHVQLAVPYGRAPAVGRYEGALGVNARSLPQPGIDVSTTGRADNAKRGRFEIRKLRLSPDNTVETLWMTFESSLTEGPGLRGDAWIGEPDTTFWLDAPADVFTDPSLPASWVAAAHGSLTPVAHWALVDEPAGCTLAATNDTSATVLWPGTTAPGDYPVILAAEGNDVQDTLTTWIHVAGPDYIELHAAPMYFLPQGLDRRFLDRDGTFAFWRNANGAISVVLDAPWNHGHWDFSRANGERIVPGTYPVTGSIPPWGTSPNGIYFVWGSLVPGVRDGYFNVTQADYSPSDSLLAFVATFEINLLNSSVPLRGEIHLPGADLPTPALVTLVEAIWTPAGARVRWHLAGRAGTFVTVERNRGAGWEAFATAAVDGTDGVLVEDCEPAPGSRVGYRLRAADGTRFPAEAWIDVPVVVAFDLQRLGANPAGGPLELAASTPVAGAASLDMLDVAGRIVDHRSWDALPAGRHVVTLDGMRSLTPGIYFVRWASGGRTLTRSIVVLR